MRPLLIIGVGAAPLGAAPCALLEPNVTYTAPAHYAEVKGVADAASCCAACAEDAAKCRSWSYNAAKDRGACWLRPGVPTARAPKAGITSGLGPPAAPTPPPPPPPPPAPAGALNVLMIAVDDLRPVGAAFGEPEALTPHIDALAARSTIFANAYVQAATCGVSRSSLLTSRRPDTNEVLANGACPFTTRPEHASWVSLPQFFAQAGYATHGMGKIYHPNVCDGAAVGEQAAAWTEPYYHAPCISLGSIYNHTCYESYPGPLPEGPGGKVTSIFANASAGSAEDMPDGMIAAHAVSTLGAIAAAKGANGGAGDGSAAAARPFFLAVGFHKPHLPHIAPKEFFDLYPLESVSLPAAAARNAPQGAPEGSWNGCSEWQSYGDVKAAAKENGFGHGTHMNDTQTRMQRQAYFAAASFADAQIGKVLDALAATGLDKTTVVTLWGDHGWHIGENNEWAKHTAMTWANRAPLLFSAPGAPAGQVVDRSFAEFVDLHPTLADLAGLATPPRCDTADMSRSAPSCTEGASLAAAVRGAGVPAKKAAFGQWPKKVAGRSAMGYNLYTFLSPELDRGAASQVRYTEWVKYNKSGDVHGPVWQKDLSGIVELYNRTADPGENFNLAEKPEMAAIVANLSAQLHAGWRAL